MKALLWSSAAAVLEISAALSTTEKLLCALPHPDPLGQLTRLIAEDVFSFRFA